MKNRMPRKSLPFFPFLLFLAIIIFTSANQAKPDGQHVYYGYIPSKIFTNITTTYGEVRYGVDPKSVATRALLGVVSNYDSTNVEIYMLPDKVLVEEFTLDTLEKRIFHLPNGSFFKVLTDKPAFVILMGGVDLEEGDATINTFYTSKNGGYVGKEFNFIAVQARVGMPYKVFAVEDSDITIWDENGTKVSDFELSANKAKTLSFNPFGVYRLLSTGNVILQTFTIGRSCFYPAVRGGFVGNVFYGSSEPWAWTPGGGGQFRADLGRAFIVSSVEDSKISIIDPEYEKNLVDTSVSARSNLTLREVKASYVMVKGERPVMLMFKSDDWEGGLAFTGVRANQTVYVYVPIGEAYVFVYKDTVVNVDDLTLTLSVDNILPIHEGLHKLSATQNIVIEVVNVVNDQGVVTFGACVPSVQSLDVSYEDLIIEPVIEEETQWTQVIYAAVAIVAILAGGTYFLKLRKKRAGKLS